MYPKGFSFNYNGRLQFHLLKLVDLIYHKVFEIHLLYGYTRCDPFIMGMEDGGTINFGYDFEIIEYLRNRCFEKTVFTHPESDPRVLIVHLLRIQRKAKAMLWTNLYNPKWCK